MTQLRCLRRELEKHREGQRDQLVLIKRRVGVGQQRLFVEVFHPLLAGAAQVVDRFVVRDPKQPPAHICHRGRGQGRIRFGQRLLHHILSVHDRSDHPRAIAVQLGANVLDKRFELGGCARGC